MNLQNDRPISRGGILLINTLDEWSSKVNEPERMPVNLNLGLLRVATLLNQSGYRVTLVDLLSDPDYQDIITNFLEQETVWFAVVSVNIKGVASGLEISKFLKKQKPELPIVWGSMGRAFFGPFVILYPSLVLENENIDYACLGTEYETLELANVLSRNSNETDTIRAIEEIAGIGHKLKGKIEFTQAPSNSKRDLMSEDYSLVDMERYIYRSGLDCLYIPGKVPQIKKVIPITTGEGCPYRCSFCINSNPQVGGMLRLKSANTLKNQVESIVQTYDPDLIWFQDDNLFVNRKRAYELFDYFERRDFRFQWSGQTRLDYFQDNYITEEFFKKIARSCVWFGAGFETFSERLRNIYNKKVSSGMLYRAAALCQKYGVPFNPAFIVGTVDETRDEMVDNLLSILDFKARFCLSGITYQLYRPYPGTVEYEKLKTQGYLTTEPQSLEEWIGTDFYDDIDKFEWLKPGKGELAKTLCSVVGFAYAVYFRPGPGTVFKRWAYRLYRPVLEYRLRRSNLGMERTLLKFILRLKNSLTRVWRRQ